MKGTQESNDEYGDGVVTLDLDPLTTTPSANLTLDGLTFNFAFLAAVRRDDFRAELLEDAIL